MRTQLIEATIAAARKRRAAALCGLGAAAMAFLVPAIGGVGQPGYSHVAQYISELGAAGAANAGLVGGLGFVPIGVLVIAFLVLASPSFPPSMPTRVGVVCFGAVGGGYLAAAVFPCDAGCPSSGSLSQSLHNLFGLVEYIGAIAGLRFLALAFRGDQVWRPFAPLCLFAAFLIGLAFVAMLAPELEAYRGLSQRVAEAAIFLWIASVSVFLLRRG